jgi:hypothetical protein
MSILRDYLMFLRANRTWLLLVPLAIFVLLLIVLTLFGRAESAPFMYRLY